jgi:glucokinase
LTGSVAGPAGAAPAGAGASGAGASGAGAVAAVDWGGTWLRVAVARGGAWLVQAREARPDGFGSQCSLVVELVRRLGAEAGAPVRALGVGIAGVTRNGRVESASNLGLKAPCDLAGRLRDVLGRPVVVVNDTQAAAVGEATSFGPGMIVLLTVGTGIGGAVVSDGRLVTGEGAAGDFGHMTVDVHGPPCVCGGRGCLEQLVSGRVLDEVARGLGLAHAGELDLAAAAGDPRARAALEAAADTLTWALRSVVAAADPRVIVLGGGLMGSGRLLPRLVGERWAAVRPPWSAAELRAARFGADAGLHGAARLGAALLASSSALPGPPHRLHPGDVAWSCGPAV